MLGWLYSEMPTGEKDKTKRWVESFAEFPYPDIPPYLSGIFAIFTNHLGMATPAEYGYRPLTYAEVQAYNESTGANLAGWEVLWLVRLSKEFCRKSNQRGASQDEYIVCSGRAIEARKVYFWDAKENQLGSIIASINDIEDEIVEQGEAMGLYSLDKMKDGLHPEIVKAIPEKTLKELINENYL